MKLPCIGVIHISIILFFEMKSANTCQINIFKIVSPEGLCQDSYLWQSPGMEF